MLKSPDQRRIRALEVLKRKVLQNQSIETIAKALNVSHDTIERDILYARKANLLKKLEDQMVNELFPKAFKRLMREMDKPEGDLKLAKDLMYSLGVMLKPATRQQTEASQVEEESLAAWVQASRITDAQDQLEKANTVEGELVDSAGISPGDLDRIAGYLETSAGRADGDPDEAATAAPDQKPGEAVGQ